MAENIEESAKISLDKLNILFGVATVENAYDDIASVNILNKEEILTREPLLLEESKELMGEAIFR